jgi:hypothetical protein
LTRSSYQNQWWLVWDVAMQRVVPVDCQICCGRVAKLVPAIGPVEDYIEGWSKMRSLRDLLVLWGYVLLLLLHRASVSFSLFDHHDDSLQGRILCSLVGISGRAYTESQYHSLDEKKTVTCCSARFDDTSS